MLNQLIEALAEYQVKPINQKKEYAVLLPLIYFENEWHILYEVRSEDVPQPGDVSFPGGAVEQGETYLNAAIRETTEELQIEAEQIQVLGEIDYIVNSQSTIRCFIGNLLISDWTKIQPNEEVAKLFTVSLNMLLTHPPKYYPLFFEMSQNDSFPFHRIRHGYEYQFSTQNRSIPFYDLSDENIWGMTAQFTHRFTEILKASQSPKD